MDPAGVLVAAAGKCNFKRITMLITEGPVAECMQHGPFFISQHELLLIYKAYFREVRT